MLEVFLAFLRLGCTSFGGPAAHLGYFRDEFVRRRQWLTEAQFAQCIAISQLLPGPGSSQTGMLVGLLRSGWPGAVAAWLGFTLPSAVAMTAFAFYAPRGFAGAGWLHGLLVAAVAMVAAAVLTMSRALLSGPVQLALAFATMAAMLLFPQPATAPLSIGISAFLAMLLVRNDARPQHQLLALRTSRRAGVVAFAIFIVLVAGLPLAAKLQHGKMPALISSLFDTGSFVFGGGHVVLPLLQSQVVSAGIASARQIIAGYAAAQAVPGPLFTLSSYVGAVAFDGSLGIAGAVAGTIAIFFPSFLLLAGIAPFYEMLSGDRRFACALAGANASVVGLLASAFVTPIWSNAVHSVLDAALAALAFAALTLLRLPAWAIVAAAAVAGVLLFR